MERCVQRTEWQGRVFFPSARFKSSAPRAQHEADWRPTARLGGSSTQCAPDTRIRWSSSPATTGLMTHIYLLQQPAASARPVRSEGGSGACTGRHLDTADCVVTRHDRCRCRLRRRIDFFPTVMAITKLTLAPGVAEQLRGRDAAPGREGSRWCGTTGCRCPASATAIRHDWRSLSSL